VWAYLAHRNGKLKIDRLCPKTPPKPAVPSPGRFFVQLLNIIIYYIYSCQYFYVSSRYHLIMAILCLAFADRFSAPPASSLWCGIRVIICNGHPACIYLLPPVIIFLVENILSVALFFVHWVSYFFMDMVILYLLIFYKYINFQFIFK